MTAVFPDTEVPIDIFARSTQPTRKHRRNIRLRRKRSDTLCSKDDEPIILDHLHHAVVTDPDTPQVVWSRQPRHARRTWVVGQRGDLPQNTDTARSSRRSTGNGIAQTPKSATISRSAPEES